MISLLFRTLQVISGLSVNRALTPVNDVVPPREALQQPAVPAGWAAPLDGPGLPVPVLPAVGGSGRRPGRSKGRQGRGGRPGRPGSQPIRRFALLFTLLLPAGREAALPRLEAEAASAGPAGEPQHGAAQRTQRSWEEHPGTLGPKGPPTANTTPHSHMHGISPYS